MSQLIFPMKKRKGIEEKISRKENYEYLFDLIDIKTETNETMTYWSSVFDDCHGNEAERVMDAMQRLSHKRRRDARASVNINWAPSEPWKVHDGLNLVLSRARGGSPRRSRNYVLFSFHSCIHDMMLFRHVV